MDEIANCYPPRVPVDLDRMADMLTALIEGAIIPSRVTGEKSIFVDQVVHCRSFVKAVFVGAPSA